MHHLIEISYINFLLKSSETSTRQMHKRNWDEGWESVQEEEEGMRLGNMRTWRVWNFSFPMHNSSGMKHKLLRMKAQWKNISENRRNRHILKNIMIYTFCCSILKWWETTLGDSSVKCYLHLALWISMMQSDGTLTPEESMPHKIRNHLEHAAPILMTLMSILLEPFCSQPTHQPFRGVI